MFHQVRAGLFAGLTVSLVAGCAYLPQGYPSRTAHAPVDNADDNDAELFVDTGALQTGENPGLIKLRNAPEHGLRIRKSKRGNMDSYVVRGQRYYTLDSSEGYSARGIASWYGPNFHGRVASNGEVYDMYRLTAAHKTLPLPTYARVTHLDNGKSVVVKINDRGPFAGDRLIDLSFAAALELGMVNDGTAMVEMKALSPQELLVMSGPENSMEIDFFYDHSAPSREKPKVAMDSLFYDDRSTEDSDVATAEPPRLPESGEAVDMTVMSVSGEVAVDGNVTANDSEEVLVPVGNGTTDGAVVDISSVKTDVLEIVVPRRTMPSETDEKPTDAAQGNTDGVDVSLQDLAVEHSDAVSDANLADGHSVALPLLENTAAAESSAAALPAVVTAGGESFPEWK